jgi:hypothetical protein
MAFMLEGQDDPVKFFSASLRDSAPLWRFFVVSVSSAPSNDKKAGPS